MKTNTVSLVNSTGPVPIAGPAGKKKHFTVSFRVLLVVMVCMAVWSPTAIIVGVSQVRTQTVADRGVMRRVPMYSDRLRDLVRQSLLRAEAISEMNALDVRSGIFDVSASPSAGELLAMRWRFANQVAAHNASSDAFVSKCDGRLFGRFSLKRSGLEGWWQTDSNGTLQEYTVNPANQNLTSLDWTTPGFNATGDQYYRTDTKWWTPAYMWQGMPWVTYAVPTNGTDGHTFWGVAGTDFLVGDIGDLFLSNDVSAAGFAMLLDIQTHTLLATSDRSVPVMSDPDPKTGEQQPLLVNQTNSSLVLRIMSHVQSSMGGWKGLEAAVEDEISTPAEKMDGWLLTFTSVHRAGLDWIICVAVPHTVEPLDWPSVVTAVCVTVAAVAAAIIVALLVVRPLRRLTGQMMAITRLEFQKKSSSTLSPLSEFAELNESFMRLRQGIIAMTKYIPKPIVRDILGDAYKNINDPGDLQRQSSVQLLGMAPRKLTILFTDIKGFTTMSEALPRHQVVDMLNLWLKEFTIVIHRNHGTVDKYIGDCIMAFWGAPERVEDQEFLACKTALEFNECIDTLNARCEQLKMPKLGCRVGIHTGEILVGNIGYEERMNYTVVGTAANIASRLEQLGKTYNCSPLVSGDVMQAVKDRFVCVWLDDLILRGHKNLVTSVFHLACPTRMANALQVKMAHGMDSLAGARGTDSALIALSEVKRVAEADEKIKQTYGAALEILQAQEGRAKAHKKENVSNAPGADDEDEHK